MKLTEIEKQCRFYLKGGLCSNKYAPNPTHSRCIGHRMCGEWRDNHILTEHAPEQCYKEIRLSSNRRTYITYNCNLCEYTTRSKNWMIKHLAKKHGITH